MQFEAIGQSGAQLVWPVVHADERGRFLRSWCAPSFAGAGIDFAPVQGNSTWTERRRTVRGMHFQRAPRADAKLVRCSRGRIHDVIVDLRPDAPTRGRQFAVELGADRGAMLFVPAGFAHGFQTLTDDVIVEYLMGAEYAPELYDGFRHDDPSLPVEWPEPVETLSQSDQRWPDLAVRMPWVRAP